MKKEHREKMNHTDEAEQKHSMVCNDQLFFQELRIAAEEAEKDYDEQDHLKS
ncbi:hypothetical protein AABM38_14070 [Heyndrickxia sp. MSNUG]|uniref:hypothetical protein n=1 Tax=Heyndrickxia sp. MSNUG TaxID=3136677 RepID=UPI003C2FE7AA